MRGEQMPAAQKLRASDYIKAKTVVIERIQVIIAVLFNLYHL